MFEGSCQLEAAVSASSPPKGVPGSIPDSGANSEPPLLTQERLSAKVLNDTLSFNKLRGACSRLEDKGNKANM
jgi:hypothetical protein